MSPDITIVFALGAFTYPAYAYPEFQVTYPDYFRVPFFERSTTTPVTVEDYADFLVTELKKLKRRKVVLVGHSAGAVAAYRAAAKLAQNDEHKHIIGLVLMHPANIGPGETRIKPPSADPRRMFTNITTLNYFWEHAHDAIFSSFLDEPRRRAKEVFRMQGLSEPHVRKSGESMTFVYSALDGSASAESAYPKDRIVILRGEADNVTTPAMVDETVANIGSGVKLVRAKKLDHNTPILDPKGKVLNRCLSRLDLQFP